jgi:uncharacterized protein (TIGR02284 family)
MPLKLIQIIPHCRDTNYSQIFQNFLMEILMNTENCIDVCNQLLRGELSAIETYKQAVEKLKHNRNSTRLERIRNDHKESARKLRDNVVKMGGQPDQDSGSWGTFAKLVEGGARMFGERAAIRALVEGEQHGIKEYEEALGDDDVLSECKSMIRTELLPKQQHHIDELKSISAELEVM